LPRCFPASCWILPGPAIFRQCATLCGPARRLCRERGHSACRTCLRKFPTDHAQGTLAPPSADGTRGGKADSRGLVGICNPPHCATPSAPRLLRDHRTNCLELSPHRQRLGISRTTTLYRNKIQKTQYSSREIDENGRQRMIDLARCNRKGRSRVASKAYFPNITPQDQPASLAAFSCDLSPSKRGFKQSYKDRDPALEPALRTEHPCSRRSAPA